jgi:hypothetical protein
LVVTLLLVFKGRSPFASVLRLKTKYHKREQKWRRWVIDSAITENARVGLVTVYDLNYTIMRFGHGRVLALFQRKPAPCVISHAMCSTMAN